MAINLGRTAQRRAQATALGGLFRLLELAGPRRSSSIGGSIARLIGPRLAASRTADRNLRQALPALDAAARAAVVRSVWDNLGRTATELPHLASFRRTESGRGWEIDGEEHVDALRRSGRPALFFSGHLGNWELILPIAAGLGLPVSGFYRASSNPLIDRLVQAQRRKGAGEATHMFAKGASGARAAIRHLQSGGSLGLLVDQKMNDGIAVPFFGRPAMTAPALAHLALRFRMPVVPVHVVRLGDERFRMVCEAPLALAAPTRDRAADIHAISLLVNQTLERWVRAEPGSWLWLHRRWPKRTPTT